jgi:hypothetical protein
VNAVLVLLVVLALGALAWAVVLRGNLNTARSRLDAAEKHAAALDLDRRAITEQLAAAQRETTEALTRADARDKHAATARQARDEAMERTERETQRATRAETVAVAAKTAAATAKATATDATAHLEAAEAELNSLRTDFDLVDRRRRLAEAATTLLPPEGLWALEQQRIERLWRDRLALSRLDPSPLTDAPDACAVAVGVLAAASREESGVVIDLTWQLEPTHPALAVLVLRVAEELIATARQSDGGELEIVANATDVQMRLLTDPPVDATELEAVVRHFGGSVGAEREWLVVQVPMEAVVHSSS